MTQPPVPGSFPGKPPIAGGTPAPTPDSYTSSVLRGYGPAIAQALTDRFYAVWPELYERYKERGRQHTHEDQYWHLSTLDTALRLESPALWIEYVEWLRTFLSGRGMGDDIAGANFVWLRELIADLSVAGDEAAERERVLDYLDQAIALFPEDARTPPPPRA